MQSLREFKVFTDELLQSNSKALREQVWQNPEEYIGLTIAVQYFEETQNQQGGKSLRFPVFIDFRYDK